jgi:DDE superfamily endonuclease/Tc5 transposase DNA-binding domain
LPRLLEFIDNIFSGNSSFTASDGWFEKFKRRHGISRLTMSGESADASEEDANLFKETVLPNLLKNYSADNIFNADETGFFYRCLPNETYGFKNEQCHGGKKSKERLTVMVCANMSGTEKCELLVIGKSRSPRCFKNVRSLPVQYEANKNAWMTSVLFEKWLLKLDEQFLAQQRSVLLFVDNCSAHPKNVQDKLQAIKLEFFPPNMTSKLQPCDLGIIKNIKHYYRESMVKEMIYYIDRNEEMPKLTVLDAVRNLAEVWQTQVKETTIFNCFRKAGFVANDVLVDSIDNENSESCQNEGVVVQMCEDWDVLNTRLGNMDLAFGDYLEVDDNVSICGILSDEDII